MFFVTAHQENPHQVLAIFGTDDPETAQMTHQGWRDFYRERRVWAQVSLGEAASLSHFILSHPEVGLFPSAEPSIADCQFCRAHLGWGREGVDTETAEDLSVSAWFLGHCLLCHHYYEVPEPVVRYGPLKDWDDPTQEAYGRHVRHCEVLGSILAT